MTRQEVNAQYQLPMELLQAYENWNLLGCTSESSGEWQYNNRDLQQLSLITTLQSIGFSCGEIEHYMRLLLKQHGSEKPRLKMLEQKRSVILDEIHVRERHVEQIDYLRHQIKKEQKMQ